MKIRSRWCFVIVAPNFFLNKTILSLNLSTHLSNVHSQNSASYFISLRYCSLSFKTWSLGWITCKAASAFFAYARTCHWNMVLFFTFFVLRVDSSLVITSNTGSRTLSFAFLLAIFLLIGQIRPSTTLVGFFTGGGCKGAESAGSAGCVAFRVCPHLIYP